MLNKDENNNEKQEPEVKEDDGILDVANMTVQCHIMIKDKDTGNVLLNKRG